MSDRKQGLISVEDLVGLRKLYEHKHGKTISELGKLNSAGSMYLTCSPLLTVLRRVFHRELIRDKGAFPVPASLGELASALKEWHCPLEAGSFVDPGYVPGMIQDAINAVLCELEDLPIKMSSKTGVSSSPDDTMSGLKEIFGENASETPKQYLTYGCPGFTSDASIIAEWRLLL